MKMGIASSHKSSLQARLAQVAAVAFFDLAALVLAVKRRVPFYEMQYWLGYQDERIYLQQHPEQENWPPAQRFNYMKLRGRTYTVGQPVDVRSDSF
jgi:hypothetical protein